MKVFKAYEKWHSEEEFDLVFLLNNSSKDDWNTFSEGRFSKAPYSLIKLIQEPVYDNPTPVIVAEFQNEEEFNTYAKQKSVGKFPFSVEQEMTDVGIHTITKFMEISEQEAVKLLNPQ